MKISTYMSFLLIVGVILFAFSMMATESNTYYPDSGVNSSQWDNKYDFSNDINSSISPLQKAFNDLSDPDKGWWSKLTSGIAAIPYAVIQLPIVLFQSFVMGGKLITGTFTSLGVNSYIIGVVLISVLLWGIFKLIEIYQRWQV